MISHYFKHWTAAKSLLFFLVPHTLNDNHQGSGCATARRKMCQCLRVSPGPLFLPGHMAKLHFPASLHLARSLGLVFTNGT